MPKIVTHTSVIIAFFTAFAVQAHAMKAPDQVVKETVDSIVNNIQSNREVYEKDTQALYTMVEETLVPALHVPRMANLILGKENSRNASAAQKEAFVEEFKTLLMRSYATALLEYSGDEKVVYEEISLPAGADKVTVNAELVTSNGARFPISLYMSNRKDTRWRAFNLKVAGINFIKTYRAVFGAIIAKQGMDGLIADLRQQNSN